MSIHESGIQFAGENLILNGSGALYWPAQKLLAIADLHLEKGSFFAKKANPLPLYDVQDTLTRVQQLIQHYQPQKVMSLGDNIHDARSFERMSKSNADHLHSLMTSVTQWIWVIGNHDKVPYPRPSKTVLLETQITIDPILFTHKPISGNFFQIVGHYHPKLKLQHMSGACFVITPKTIFMPAFGSYTGGLDIDSVGFKKNALEKEEFKVFLLYKNKIWRVR